MAVDICLVVNSLDYGGAERQVLELGKKLIYAGYKVKIVTLYVNKISPSMVDIDIDNFHQMNHQRSLRLIFTLIKLFFILRIYNPRCVVGTMLDSDLFCRIISGMVKFKYVSNLRNYCYKNQIVSYLFGLTVRLCDVVVANNTSVAEGKSPHAILLNKTRYIPNFKTHYFSGRKDSIKAIVPEVSTELSATRTVNLVSIGSVRHQKNYVLILDVMTLLPMVTFTIFGGGNLLGLLSQAESRGVSERLFLRGEDPKAAALLYKFDIFVLASIREGMPNALLEAFAAEIPCLVSSGDGLEMFADSLCDQQIFDPRNVASLAKSIEFLAESTPEFLQQLIKRQLAVADHIFSANPIQMWCEVFFDLGVVPEK